MVVAGARTIFNECMLGVSVFWAQRPNAHLKCTHANDADDKCENHTCSLAVAATFSFGWARAHINFHNISENIFMRPNSDTINTITGQHQSFNSVLAVTVFFPTLLFAFTWAASIGVGIRVPCLAVI